MEKGYLALVLHAHLPFIRHPEHENFLEENWFFEAITDTYIPLIKVFDGLLNDGVDFNITVSLSPPLMNMLRDELLVNRYIKHLDRLIALSSREIERTRGDESVNKLAVMYRDRYLETKYIFCDKYNKDLLQAFKKFHDAGKVEVITCCATHGYLPLMDLYKPAVRAQVKVAVDTFKSVFGTIPKGIWIPECGYHPGHDEILAEFGIRYFFVETHGILFGSPRPRYGVYSPYLCKSGVAAVGRDLESSKAVWSSKEGYPGDFNYREYYRDIGYDLDYDYVKPYINSSGVRVNTGIKYHRITGTGDFKDIYNRDVAMERVGSHAANFMFNREKQVEHLSNIMDRKPLIVSPYDAELFGHWWYEGPEWINCLLRKIHYDQNTVKTTTPGKYLEMYDRYPVIQPSMSSWGCKGYSEVWLDGCNDWIYKHLHKIAELMIQSARDYKFSTDEMSKRILNQMARELLLAQSSDWAFIMKTGTFVSYAVNRTREHIGRFLALHEQLRHGNIDMNMLMEAEGKYNIFKDIDYKVYS
ncbi:glycoside hydrolase family protein [Candidatus Omnitrophus magneticus]|uniref:Glycoside hydrolase family protein n=1 Tax=Candidatus Omnitrophus magneticus TaxID=1609969 RepID=A0A0F0CS06_9BACT|nr:glycoside hydrolase family protein [Candidatus Omnitrophus magneticus]